jgi:hypothetical protein
MGSSWFLVISPTIADRRAALSSANSVVSVDEVLTMQTPLILSRLAVLLMVAAPMAAMAGDPPDRDAPPPAESRKQAYAECGGPPIQGGRDIQPTPAHDKCLAKKQKIKQRGQAGTPPPADDTTPVMPPAERQPDPK